MGPYLLKIICLVCAISVPLHAGKASTYSVPVPNELKEYATFPLPEATLRIREGVAKMEYQLPNALTGEETIKVEASGTISGPDKLFHLEGPLGDMTCTAAAKLATCHINYNPQTLSVLTPEGKETAADYLRTTISDPTELANRLKVLNVFFHEAAGTCQNVRIRYH